jgi:hypothetical protein
MGDWRSIGGVDDPKRRKGSYPADFMPAENPFYFALPYTDFAGGRRKPDAAAVVPWAKDRAWGPRESMCKNRWIRIARSGRSVIEDSLLDGVVGLPGNLFYGAGIPAALLVFDKARKHKAKGDVFFVDASREFEQGANQNRLRPADIDKIIATYRARKEIAKYSHRAPYAEIEENEFNLNIPR